MKKYESYAVQWINVVDIYGRDVYYYISFVSLLSYIHKTEYSTGFGWKIFHLLFK